MDEIDVDIVLAFDEWAAEQDARGNGIDDDYRRRYLEIFAAGWDANYEEHKYDHMGADL